MPPLNADRVAKPASPNDSPDGGGRRWYVRVVLIIVAILLATIFGIATWIQPYDEAGRPRTMATHTQLGVPECNFLAWTGKPCPSCGMSTSFALLVRGDVGASLRANWVGTLIALLWALLLPWALLSGLRGRIFFIPRGRGDLIATSIVGVFLVLMMVRWGLVLVSR